MSTTQTVGEGVSERELIDTLGRADGGLPTQVVARRCSIGRGRARARLQALEDCGTVVRRGERTRAAWTLTDEGRDRFAGGTRLVTDGGDPEEEAEDPNRFDPEVEEIPVEIGGSGEGGSLVPTKFKLIGAAVLALVVLVAVLLVVRKLRK